MSDRKSTAVIADDEAHVRVYLKAIATHLGLDVVGEASDGEQAVQLCREREPDLVLLDLNMPIKTGEEALREIRQDCGNAKVVVFSSVADRQSVEECLDLGASHFILKDAPFLEITDILRETLAQA